MTDAIYWTWLDYGSVRTKRWKLYYSESTNRLELYDLTSDLQETTNIAAANPAQLDQLVGLYQKWISDNNIMLNVCPSSNVALCRAESIKKHPIRKLFDHGIKVTINTDDLMIFGQSVSDEYMNLYRESVFSPDELETIRQNGLSVV